MAWSRRLQNWGLGIIKPMKSIDEFLGPVMEREVRFTSSQGLQDLCIEQKGYGKPMLYTDADRAVLINGKDGNDSQITFWTYNPTRTTPSKELRTTRILRKVPKKGSQVQDLQRYLDATGALSSALSTIIGTVEKTTPTLGQVKVTKGRSDNDEVFITVTLPNHPDRRSKDIEVEYAFFISKDRSQMVGPHYTTAKHDPTTYQPYEIDGYRHLYDAARVLVPDTTLNTGTEKHWASNLKSVGVVALSWEIAALLGCGINSYTEKPELSIANKQNNEQSNAARTYSSPQQPKLMRPTVALETIVGSLAETYPLLDPSTWQTSQQLCAELVRGADLNQVNRVIYTNNFFMYTIEEGEEFIYVGGKDTNPFTSNMRDAMLQLQTQGHYTVPPEQRNAIIASSRYYSSYSSPSNGANAASGVKIDVAELWLINDNSAYAHFTIDTVNYANTLTYAQLKLAECVYGNDTAFIEYMGWLAHRGIRQTSIYLPVPIEVPLVKVGIDFSNPEVNQKERAIARPCWFSGVNGVFGDFPYFDANTHYVDFQGAVRGVRQHQKIAVPDYVLVAQSLNDIMTSSHTLKGGVSIRQTQHYGVLLGSQYSGSLS